MTQTATKPQPETAPHPVIGVHSLPEVPAVRPQEGAVRWLRLLWGRRRFLSRAAIAGLLSGALLAFLLPKRFDSTTQLMPPDSQSTSGMAMLATLAAKTGSGLGAFAGDLMGLKSSGALFIGILRSRTVEDRVVDRFQLKKVYSARMEEDARQKLSENTSISEDRKSGIITITVTDRDPQRATAITQAYVEELNQLVSELSTSEAHRERVFLEERLRSVKQDLNEASRAFSQFASNNTAIDIKEQGRSMVDAAAAVMGELIATESELKGLEQIYTPSNVRVRSVRARITELRKQLEKLGGKGETEANQSASTVDSFYPSIRKLPLLGVTYADLSRQTKIQEAVYETLTQEYELAKVQEAKETPSVKVLDVAKVPEKKSFPPRLLIMFLCSFLALSEATVLVVAKARWTEVDPKDPGKIFAQEVFQTVRAQLPWASQNGSSLSSLAHRAWHRIRWHQVSGNEEQ